MIFGGCDTYLYVLDLATGKALESIEADAYIASSVAVSSEIGYVGHYDNAVIAFSTISGDILWKYKRKVFRSSLHARLRKKKYSSVDETSPCMQSIEKLAKAFGHLKPGGRSTVPCALRWESPFWVYRWKLLQHKRKHW